MSNFNEIINFSDITYKEYVDSIKNLEKFTTDKEWIWSLKYDILLNPHLGKDISSSIEAIKKDDSIGNLNKIMNDLKQKSQYYLQKAKKYNYLEKWFYYRMAHAYYGFIEVINEGSILTDKILSNLKEEYHDKYLEVLEKIDKSNPSKLTDFNKSNETIEESENIKMYLFMKNWQDKQNIYFNSFIKEHHEAKKEFEKYAKEKYPYLKNINNRSLLGVVLLNEMPLIKLDQILKFLENGIDDELSYVIGGKALGLAKLNYNNVDIPETFVIPVNSLYNTLYLNELNNLPCYNYSVRSSATVEDNKKNSFAGLFVSKLDVIKNDLNKNINEVLSSVFSERVDNYVKHFSTEKPYMAVVLQKFISPIYSGVWLGETLEKGHLEWVDGDGEKLVSGHVKPNYENWTENVKEPLKINGEAIGEKCIELQNKLNAIADFEWCNISNKLVFVQYRPTTAKITNITNDNNDELIGIPASSGIEVGVPYYLDDPNNTKNFPQDGILLTDYTDPDWVPIMIKSKAIITAEGGFLSHTAIISRELGIPCITGFGYENLKKVSQMEYIEVDGFKGTVIEK